MQKEYKAVFDYYGFDEHYLLTGAAMKGVAQAMFVVAYNKFCELVNPKYEEWNAEFNKLYPDYDGDTDEWQHTYNEWIRVKQQKLIDDNINQPEDIMNFIIDPDIEYQFVGQMRNHPECKVCFHLEEME